MAPPLPAMQNAYQNTVSPQRCLGTDDPQALAPIGLFLRAPSQSPPPVLNHEAPVRQGPGTHRGDQIRSSHIQAHQHKGHQTIEHGYHSDDEGGRAGDEEEEEEEDEEEDEEEEEDEDNYGNNSLGRHRKQEYQWKAYRFVDNPRTSLERTGRNDIEIMREEMKRGVDRLVDGVLSYRLNKNLPQSADDFVQDSGLSPKRQNPKELQKKRAIRKHLRGLLPAKELDSRSLVSTEGANDFHDIWEMTRGRRCRPCCSPSDFRINLLSPPRNSWNKSAVKVFTSDFMENRARTKHKLRFAEEEVEDLFFNRIKSLRASYLRTRKGLEAVLQHERIMRRNARKVSLFKLRANGAKKNARTRRHVRQLRRGGPKLMSSDESQVETGSNPLRSGKVYIVLEPEYREPSLTGWVHVFDSINGIDSRMKPPRGTLPRFRIYMPNKISRSNNFPRGMQINTYSNDWLSKIPDVDAFVAPSYEHYDYSHSNDVFQYVSVHSQLQQTYQQT
ncbi:hypothetical protein NLJ89_g6544 [Agrocybe chaxingu]|uniref:Uncharacterized protein n=1 Tax=Agrocybe chaxingu TaxID=84603 RepID=A0A9W8MVW9_9AGAR|nr:hypothetical protein NLJ89_g6544 [Agrocybe chaxingu]